MQLVILKLQGEYNFESRQAVANEKLHQIMIDLPCLTQINPFFLWLLAHVPTLRLILLIFKPGTDEMRLKTEKDATYVVFWEEWEKCPFMLFIDSLLCSVSSVCLCCLRFQSPPWLKALDSDIHEKDSSKLPLSFWLFCPPWLSFFSTRISERRRHWRWTILNRRSKVSGSSPLPSLNHLNTADADTTWQSITHTMTSKQPKQTWLMEHTCTMKMRALIDCFH